jgi:hypothetical protein
MNTKQNLLVPILINKTITLLIFMQNFLEDFFICAPNIKPNIKTEYVMSLSINLPDLSLLIRTNMILLITGIPNNGGRLSITLLPNFA